MGYYSALRGKELSSQDKTWRNLKCILISKSQSEKATYYKILTLRLSGKYKTMEIIKRLVLARR